MDFLTNMLGGTNIFETVQAKAKQAGLAITKDKSDFVNREESRKRFLEEDKLASMKKIMEYEGAIDKFPSVQHELVGEIESHKTANALMQETLTGLIHDKKQLTEMK